MNVILYCCAPGAPGAICHATVFPRSTVYNIFRKFQRDGVWDRVAHGLREQIGQPLDGGSRLPIGQIGGKGGDTDSQVDQDAGKQIKVRKIHALVDSEGLPVRNVVYSAAIQDRDGAGLALDKIRRRFPRLD
jgi:transposase